MQARCRQSAVRMRQMANLKCPKCGIDVPATGISGSYGMGTPGGGLNLQPARQHATCSECGTKLVRNPDDNEHGLDEWRAQMDGPRQGR